MPAYGAVRGAGHPADGGALSGAETGTQRLADGAEHAGHPADGSGAETGVQVASLGRVVEPEE